MNPEKILFVHPFLGDLIDFGSLKAFLVRHDICVKNYNLGAAMYGLAVVDAISDILMSIGTRVSYNVGACSMIPAVPTITAIVNSHKNNRSNTIATYFQSSFTYNI